MFKKNRHFATSNLLIVIIGLFIPYSLAENTDSELSKQADDATGKNITLVDGVTSSNIDSYQVKFGGWSEHYISGGAANYNFNENHEGIGLAFSSFDDDGSNDDFFNGYNYDIWYMKDSLHKDNVQMSYGLFHRQLIDGWGIESIDMGLNFAAISRSTADIDSTTAELKEHKRIHTLVIIPSLSFYTQYKVHLDFVFLPPIPNINDYSVLFFRVGINL